LRQNVPSLAFTPLITTSSVVFLVREFLFTYNTGAARINAPQKSCAEKAFRGGGKSVFLRYSQRGKHFRHSDGKFFIGGGQQINVEMNAQSICLIKI